jgi:excisionase family DNA binding protein
MHEPQAHARSFLTAHDVCDLLGVDPATVYRMAADGRLPAVKIGRQWRFPAEPLRAAVREGVPASPAAGQASSADHVHGAGYAHSAGYAPHTAAHAARPTWQDPALVQDLLDIAAESLGLMMVVTDLYGRPVSGVANPCPWFRVHGDDPAVLAACAAEWRDLAEDLDFSPRFEIGSLGFECARSLIRSGPHLVGMVLAGGLAPADEDGRSSAATGLHALTLSERARALATLPKVAAALSRLAGHGDAPGPASGSMLEGSTA